MYITVDMGNTNIFIGVHKDGTIVHTFRTLTDRSKSYDEYKIIFTEFKEKYSLNEKCEGAIISSVVPLLTMVVTKAIRDTFETEVKIFGPGLKSGLPIKMDNPSEVGADLIAVAVGSLTKYEKPCLVVDLGTASKITVVDKNGAFVGGIVMPGILISLRALASNAAQLSEIDLIAPQHVIGKNTSDSMNSGSIYGTVAQIVGLCKMVEQELGYECNRVLTGGYAPLVKEFLPSFHYERNIVLEGLYSILIKNIK